LSFESLVIRSVEGERSFGIDELPLRVGTGAECQLRLPGPGGEPVAQLDLLDGVPIVQPMGRDTLLRINDSSLAASRRLVDGDVLQFYGSEIRIAIGENGVVVDVRLEDSAYVTKPPVADEDADRPDDESIAPTAFRRVAETHAQAIGEKRSTLKYFIGAALFVLLTMSFLLFTSKSVEFELDPTEPDAFSVDGGWFPAGRL
jgi:hypothetical protein